MSTWTPKPPETSEFFTLDYKKQMSVDDSLLDCSCAVAVVKGDDPDAEDMLDGPVEINGTEATQKVRGGIYGCRYQLTFMATTALGETLKLWGDFYVGNEAPGDRDLTTLQAVRDWLGIKNHGDDALLQRLITAESKAIEKAIQRPILLETRTDFIKGYGSATIMPPATPIQRVEKVLIDGAAVAVHHDCLTVWRADGQSWMRNSRIQMTYTAGYDSVPFDLEQACVELVALRYREKDRVGQASKSMEGGVVSYITRAIPHSVESRLAPYKKVAPC